MLKSDTQADLLTAIKSILANSKFISPGVAGQLIEGCAAGKETVASNSSRDTLTNQERKILKLIAEGYKNREIADYLSISVNTVRKHRQHLMQKLHVCDVASLKELAVSKGLITITK